MKRRHLASPSSSAKRLRVAAAVPAFQVFCRLQSASSDLRVSGTAVLTASDAYSFSRVFQRAEQNEVYAAIGAPAVKAFLESKSSVVCICGLRKSGRRFSLFGDKTDLGLAPRIIQELLRTSVASHLALSCVAVGPTAAKDLLSHSADLRSAPTSLAVKSVEDVMKCSESYARCTDSHFVLVIKTQGSLRTSTLALLLLSAPSPRTENQKSHLANCYSVVQALASALHSSVSLPSPLCLALPPVLAVSTTTLTVLCTVTAEQRSCAFLRMLSLVAHNPALDKIPKRHSVSPERRDDREEIEALKEALLRKDARIAELEIAIAQPKSETDTERATRSAVLCEISVALESMERVYKQNKSLIVDAYEDILMEKNAQWQRRSDLQRPTKHVETQCRAEIRDVGAGPDEKPKRTAVVPMSPISSRTRGATKRRGK